MKNKCKFQTEEELEEWAAIEIQRIYRGYMGVRKTRKARLKRYRKKLLARFNEGFRFYFEQQGAAFKIQRWFKTLNYVRKFYARKWIVKWTKIRNGKANLIQRVFRGHQCRLGVWHLKEQIKAEKSHDKKYLSARKIQSIVRMFIVRCNLDDYAYDHLKPVHASFKKGKFRQLITNKRRRVHLLYRYVNLTDYQLSVINSSTGTQDALVSGDVERFNGINQIFASSVEMISKMLFDSEYDATKRRKSVFLPHLAIETLDVFEKMNACAFKIQKRYKKFLVVMREYHKRVAIEFSAAVRISRWMLRWSRYQELKRACALIQPYWKRASRISKLKKKAVLVLQSNFRRRRVRKRYLEKLWQNEHSFHVITRWGRCMAAKIVRKREIAKMRLKYDVAQAGYSLYKQSEHYLFADNLWKGMKSTKKSNVPLHEMQALFHSMASYGLIDHTRLMKYLKDSKCFADSTEASLCETAFLRLKTSNEKKIDFLQFIELLYCLAVCKYSKINLRISDNYASSGVPTNITTIIANTEDKIEKKAITTFKYCRLLGKGAYLVLFVEKFIAPTQEYKKSIQSLKKALAVNVTARSIDSAVRKIQVVLLGKVCRLRFARMKTE